MKKKETAPLPKGKIHVKGALKFKIPAGWDAEKDQLYSLDMVGMFLRSRISGCPSCTKHQKCEIVHKVKKTAKKSGLLWPEEWLIICPLLRYMYPKKKILCLGRIEKK